MGARRAGSSTRVENVYDVNEVSFRTNLYREAGTEWETIDPSVLGF